MSRAASKVERQGSRIWKGWRGSPVRREARPRVIGIKPRESTAGICTCKSPMHLRTRRSFLQAFGAGVLGVRGSFAVAAESREELVIPVLGDLHFDKPEHHDLEWLRANHAGDERQIENYCRVTKDWSPKLFDLARQRAAEGGPAAPFLLQLGDLVEGLCGNEKLAETQMREAIAWAKGDGKGVPFAMCKGNHDVTGPGATEVYDRVLVPFLQN